MARLTDEYIALAYIDATLRNAPDEVAGIRDLMNHRPDTDWIATMNQVLDQVATC